MADIAVTDVTVTLLNQRRVEGRKYNRCQIVFGDAALTYPAGGVPVSKGAFGCPNVIESLKVVDQSLFTYDFYYDQANEKIILRKKTHTHSLHLNNGDQVDGATTRINAATDKLGGNTGADILVAGVVDVSGDGGVVQDTLAEPSTVAIAEQTIEVEVIGW